MTDTKKRILITISIIVIVVLIAYYYTKVEDVNNYNIACTMDAKMCPDGSYVGRTAPLCEFAPCPLLTQDEKNTSYIIDGEIIKLTDGKFEAVMDVNSDTKNIVQYFGNELIGDFNSDSLLDKAFYLTKNSGGSGTFFYFVVALKFKSGYVGTNAIFLGDRISPQNSNFIDGEIVSNYAIRKANDSMSTEPSIAISRRFKIVESSLVEAENYQ